MFPSVVIIVRESLSNPLSNRYISNTINICWIIQYVMISMLHHTNTKHPNRVDSRLAPIQWGTSLRNNAVAHWLGANLESALPQDESLYSFAVSVRSPNYKDRTGNLPSVGTAQGLSVASGNTGGNFTHHMNQQCIAACPKCIEHIDIHI